MCREQRLRVWQRLGRYDSLEVLELGNCGHLDDEELRVVVQMVLPARLDSVRLLFLGWIPELSDAGVQALAETGCGKNLQSLYLACECSFCTTTGSEKRPVFSDVLPACFPSLSCSDTVRPLSLPLSLSTFLCPPFFLQV